MKNRIYNFNAGPAVMPEPVLQEVQRSLFDFDKTGIGILEHSHRGKAFSETLQETIADCRVLAKIPESHAIIFMQGGASLQFTMLPANFLSNQGTADYLDTGSWSKKAIAEARFYGNVHIAGTSESEGYNHIPDLGDISYSPSPEFVHFTSNNTIFGTQWDQEPALPKNAWLACDASSDLFSRPLNVNKYGLIYAGAQKNLGPAGVTLGVIRRDLLDRVIRDLPKALRYSTYTEHNSLYNTPPVFGIYVVGRVLKWILQQGGLDSMAHINQEKARLLYDVLDANDFYTGIARPQSRSRMNVTFRTPNSSLDDQFAKEASENGLAGLRGHRSAGGLRASIYNAFPISGCKILAAFMHDFSDRHG